MDKKLSSTNIFHLIFIVIIIFHILNNCFWFSIDKFPAYGDDVHGHLFRVLRLSESIKSFRKVPISYNGLLEFCGSYSYPPLFQLIGATIHLADMSNLPFHIIYLTPLVFFIISMHFVYKIGKEIFDKKTGLLAAMIVSFYPEIYKHSRYFNDGIALVAMVSFSTYCLLRTRSFRSIKFSLLFGIAFGLGMLTKELFIIYMLPLVTFIILQSLSVRSDRLKKILNVIIFVCLSSSITLATGYYQGVGGDLHSVWLRIFRPWHWSEIDRATQYKSLFYVAVIERNLLTLFFTVLFLTAFCYFLISKVSKRDKFFLILWLFLPGLFLTLFPLKDSRYVLPSLAPMALISAYGVTKIKSHIAQCIMIGFILFLSVTQYYLISFGTCLSNLNLGNRFLNTILRPDISEPPSTCHWVDTYASFFKTQLANHNSTISVFFYQEPHHDVCFKFNYGLQLYMKLNRLYKIHSYFDDLSLQQFLETLEIADMYICLSHDPNLSQRISEHNISLQTFQFAHSNTKEPVMVIMTLPEEEEERFTRALSTFKLAKRIERPFCNGYAYLFIKETKN